MVNINKYISQFDVNLFEFSRFVISNNWFGINGESTKDGWIIDDSDFELIKDILDSFCKNNSKTKKDKFTLLAKDLAFSLPDTAKKLHIFLENNKYNDNAQYVLCDFLLSNLPGEICMCDDKEISYIVEEANKALPKNCIDTLFEFLSWLKNNYRTIYRNMYKSEHIPLIHNDAYSEEEYLNIFYHLFSPTYIENNEMYIKAANNQKYINLWLTLSLLQISTNRRKDTVDIPHPKLTTTPQKVLEQVRNNTFTNEDSIATYYSVIEQMIADQYKPNKTKSKKWVPNIRKFIPEFDNIHFGKLFAIAEAHFQINKCNGQLLFKTTLNYKNIRNIMGEEFANPFIKYNFRIRSATKSNLQNLVTYNEEVYDGNYNIFDSYLLASLARAHKGTFGKFSNMTTTYLKGIKTNGMTSEFVAKELFERGTLSFITSRMLNMITNEKYNKLSFHNQTKVIQFTNLSPSEINQSVAITDKLSKKSMEIVNKIYKETSDLTTILHNIVNKNVNSKDDTGLCLMFSMGKTCPYHDTQNCISCEYEIGTKYTLILMLNELKRLKKEYKNSKNPIERNKYKYLATELIAPKIQEMLLCLEQNYGKESITSLEKIMEEHNG